MSNLQFRRHRRLRQTASIRNMVRETTLHVNDLIYPIFVTEGNNVKNEVPSMPEVYQLSLDLLNEEVEEVVSLGIPAIILFGVPNVKDEHGSQAFDENGIVQKAIRQVKDTFP